MKVEFLKPVVVRNASNGALTSYACGQVAEVTSEVGAAYISAGYAVEYTLLTPTGTKTITANGENIDVAEYAKVTVNVADSPSVT